MELTDYKDWIQKRAEEIVFNLFIEPFDREWDWEDMWRRHEDWAYKIAIDNYKDTYASGMNM